MPVGKLGLPLVEAETGVESLLSYEERVSFEYSIAARTENPLIEAIKSSLHSDTRFKAIDGMSSRCGNVGGPLNSHKLLAWFLWRANEVGFSAAQNDLENFLDKPRTAPCSAVLWVHGTETNQRIILGRDIQLVPISEMPLSGDKEAILRAELTIRRGPSPTPKAALVKTFQSNKIVGDLQQTVAAENFFKARSELYDTLWLMNCLPTVTCFPAWDTAYDPPEIPLGPLGARGHAHNGYDIVPYSTTKVSKSSFSCFPDLTEGYGELPEKSRVSVKKALQRLAQAKIRKSSDDKSLDLGIALEMLLLGSGNFSGPPSGPLSLRFKQRGSWAIGRDSLERKKLFEQLEVIYDLRSEVAHNGISERLAGMDYSEKENLIAENISLAEKITRSLITQGLPVDWLDVIKS